MLQNSSFNVAYLASEFGAVTSTFIYREIEALKSLGARIDTYSTRRPADSLVSAEAVPLVKATVYLHDLPIALMLRDIAATAFSSPCRSFNTALQALRDMLRAEVPGPSDRLKLLWHFILACALARRLRKRGTQHLHAHFAHVPTTVAMYAAELAGIPYSFTAHANDIFERPTALKEKVARSLFTVCISEYNRRHLESIGCDPRRLCVVRCAIDAAGYAFRAPRPIGSPPSLLFVGRLVEKKGGEVLVEALDRLRRRGVPFCCKIVGNGPLSDAVARRARDLSLEDGVRLMGSLPQERVKELFGEAGVFVLPCVVAKSGDRDGIPVVLMEAMALGVPVVSTTVSGIPELIESGRSGLLVPPEDPDALADALERLFNEPDLARSLVQEARKTLETTFESRRNAEILWSKMHGNVRGSD